MEIHISDYKLAKWTCNNFLENKASFFSENFGLKMTTLKCKSIWEPLPLAVITFFTEMLFGENTAGGHV